MLKRRSLILLLLISVTTFSCKDGCKTSHPIKDSHTTPTQAHIQELPPEHPENQATVDNNTKNTDAPKEAPNPTNQVGLPPTTNGELTNNGPPTSPNGQKEQNENLPTDPSKNDTQKEALPGTATKEIDNQPPAELPDKKPEPLPIPEPPKKKLITLKPATLEIIANFSKTQITVNGLPYPSYQESDQPKGVVVPAGGPYYVVAKSGNNSKSYEIYLRPYEHRILIADLTGFNGTARPPSKTPPPDLNIRNKELNRKGKVTVYAKPDASVLLDGHQIAHSTPATFEAENGRHDVKVKYKISGKISEPKTIRVRNISDIKLYFRENK